jgi:hypothetical protein
LLAPLRPSFIFNLPLKFSFSSLSHLSSQSFIMEEDSSFGSFFYTEQVWREYPPYDVFSVIRQRIF